MIKDHWDNLSERERRVLSIGGVYFFSVRIIVVSAVRRCVRLSSSRGGAATIVAIFKKCTAKNTII